MERHAHLVRAVSVLLATAVLAHPADAQEREDRSVGFAIVPSVGLALHGDFYDDRVVTTLADAEELVVNRLTVDPDAALRLEGRFEYDYVPGVRFHGGLAASWPGAEVRVEGIDPETPGDVDLSILELTGGATLELGEITEEQIPVYAGLEAGIAHHRFDEFQWRDEFVDPSATSLSVGGRAGAEYPLTPTVSLRGEIKETLVWGAFGDFESDIASVESRNAGVPADVNFEGNTFSMFSLNAGLAFRF